ncbi:RDD family protein [Streptomyces sp. NPDC093586]|uniref:RDD family protein n=1 Tax=Streptomyces sp. NPDC093586 TaxID=3366042 RepID=UPI0038195786
MSAPTPAPGDDRPREGYYPDPSIPGYVRYWNGASWVAGTSRPAPKDGEPLAPPPGVRPAAPAAASVAPVASVEETGPHFFDEDPVEEPPAASPHGGRPEAAPAWDAGQHGSERVAWPDAQGTDPRVPHARTAPGGGRTPAAPAAPALPEHPGPAGTGSPDGASPSGRSATTGPAPTGAAASAPAAAGPAAAGPAYGDPAAGDGSAEGRTARPGVSSTPADAEAGAGSTVVFRRPTAGPRTAPATDGPGADEGTITFRAVPPGAARQKGTPASGAPDTGTSPATGGPGFATGAAGRGAAGPQPIPAAVPTALSGPQRVGGPATGPAAPRQPAVPRHAQPQPAAVPAPVAVGPGGGQASWAQQVHQLAGTGGDEQPVAPWKPPVDDVFQAAARRQAAARPAGLGKRLAARLIDTVVLAGVTAVAAVPLGGKAIDHVNDKIDAAKLSGETVTVWLLDGTTGTYLGIVLAVLLLFGVVYEALPTVRWGRTLGKKLLGLEVRDIEAHEPPSLGAALRRWLVYSVPGLLAVGVVGVAWCLFDRPWHQCWHDKAARTFVAG